MDNEQSKVQQKLDLLPTEELMLALERRGTFVIIALGVAEGDVKVLTKGSLDAVSHWAAVIHQSAVSQARDLLQTNTSSSRYDN